LHLRENPELSWNGAINAAIRVLHSGNGLLFKMVQSKPNKTLHIVVLA
jgi:hypothetical protein